MRLDQERCNFLKHHHRFFHCKKFSGKSKFTSFEKVK